MKDEEKNKSSIMSFLRGVTRVPMGVILGGVTLAVSLTRVALGSLVHAALAVGGAIATSFAATAHVLNFAKGKFIQGWNKLRGNQEQRLNIDSTKALLEKTAKFTSDRVNSVISNAPDVFSGKNDEVIKAKLNLGNIPNTYDTLIHSARLAMAMSPKQIEEAKAKQHPNTKTYKKLHSHERG